MPNEVNAQVTDAEPQVVAPATNPSDGGVVDATPAAPAPSVDVEALKAEYEQKLARAAQDVNQVKSALQSREAAIQKQFAQEREALQKQMREIRMQGMDENQRKVYEASLAAEEVENMRQQLAETQRKNQEFAQMLDAQSFFIQQGVPANQLTFDNGYESLVNSGWGYLSQELQQLRKGQTPQSNQTAAPLKPAPSVVTDKAAPSVGPTWPELVAKYGSRENVYQLVESGNLSPTIIPA